MKTGVLIAICGLQIATAAAQEITEDSNGHQTGGEKTVKHTNRLANESSPYLLQHAHNPVDWYPWGPEAFEAARREDKPIFLSIGYSTCYWCHVMERESFENEEVAAILNENFIPIKVDREERPDVDDIYMTSVQLITGSGGWPLTVFLEPTSLKPFVGGTYFPPEDQFGRPGFKTVLNQVSGFWKSQRSQVTAQADKLAEMVSAQLSQPIQSQQVTSTQVEQAVGQLLTQYDQQDGGYVSNASKAPKFPMPGHVDFLLEAGWNLGPVQDSVKTTLTRMATGGMYDQVGGGFHRYSTDAKWLVPHFEKMIYDNGQLASTYARAYEETKNPYYAQIVQETLDYVIREMTSETGGFYSAQDAEVDAREGGSYLWKPEEMDQALRDAELSDDIEFALAVYGLEKGTNFQDPHHASEPPSNVLYLSDDPAKVARRMGMSLKDFNDRRRRVNAALLVARDKRKQPITDDKTLAGWNGLMIAGFADGGRVLKEQQYIDAAIAAGNDVLSNMRAADGGLLRVRRGENARVDGFLEDYAFLIKGLLALYDATGDRKWLDEAKVLAQQAHDRFWDESQGGYFDTLPGQSDLFVRARSSYDGAVPSGNSVMVSNLLDLYELTNEGKYLSDASRTLESISPMISQNPVSTIVATKALNRFVQEYPDEIGQPFILSPGNANAVRMKVSPETIQLESGGSATVTVTLRIADGHHLNSNQPGSEFAIPLEVKLVGGEGVTAQIKYPQGTRFSGPEGVVNVHSGSISVPVTLTRTGVMRGASKLMVTYQVCNDKMCLMPETKMVPVSIKAK
jgi:uncharacterized protein YyaL (SSP411 family)